MGKPPAAIFIARHGARLDAANKDWHLSSPTPYDPPLSYGGWLQSRALGVRIISELRSLENQQHQAEEGDGSKISSYCVEKRKQKRRIIIHTSPYLRCVQTAIAISSGISQNFTDVAYSQEQLQSAASTSESISSPTSDTSQSANRCLLRVDACLGEWLSPDYFESITPPPRSESMVTTAKTELLRRDRSVIPMADTQHKPYGGHFPGGWGNILSTHSEEGPRIDAESNPALSDGTSTRYRAGSYDSMKAVDTLWGRRMLRIDTNLPSLPDTVYAAPIPSYAISPSNPIPDGYVAHARDACVLVDYQWDSMREPQNWGNGGEYGDEWSTMHTRFKNGLERIISWYQEDDASTAPISRRRTRSQLQFLEQDEADDSEISTVLILVTHGAGCNALIGALSGKPALVNVPTASLTLAVRKDCLKNTLASDIECTKQYDLQNKATGPDKYHLTEVASTDHLRPGTGQSTFLRSASTTSIVSPSSSSYRHRTTYRASFSSGPTVIRPSLKDDVNLQSWTRPRTSSGLWNSSSNEEALDDLVPNFGTPTSAKATLTEGNRTETSSTSNSDNSARSSQTPKRTLSQRGLWGSAPLNRERQGNSNRRWTVADRPL
ncbi:hypothetical protein BJX61DRAFT_380610 [Aspergillus egyptiacus]|nr:hypothetical protein BJX61DRAFT_380610 [Aspergillus egyptiacus]